MRGNAFAVKRDDERRTLEGGRFQRGHYDIVVMNPGLLDVETLTYEVVRGQDYRRFVQQVRDHLNPEVPVVLYGIELIYRRSPLTPGSIRDFMEKVEQDTDKLLCSQGLEGFMDNVKMLVFVKGTDERQQDGLRERFGARPEIHLLFAH